ncbi:MAG: NUDIX hydrolase, partial [Cyclobacteriaceae bacterium]
LYQTVIGRSIDRRNFKKKIMKYGFLEETTERQQLKGAGRPGLLYRYNKEKYFELKEKGINIEI